ncbi:MAG: 23S rRNA (pseudouridine(1915)-N(3))-methyltransferase RlmH [Bacteroidota bacterium]
MKVHFWVIGKTNESYLKEGIAIYEKRLKHYLPFEYTVLPDVKNAGKLSADQLKAKEGALLLKQIRSDDYLILLDEKGKSFGSVELAHQLERWLQLPTCEAINPSRVT